MQGKTEAVHPSWAMNGNQNNVRRALGGPLGETSDNQIRISSYDAEQTVTRSKVR